MKKQILAALLAFAFAGTTLMPSALAAVDYTVTGNSNIPTNINQPANFPTDLQKDSPVKKDSTIKKDKTSKNKIKRPKKTNTQPTMRKPHNGQRPGWNQQHPNNNQRPDWNKPKPHDNRHPGWNQQHPNNNQRPDWNKPRPNNNQHPGAATNPSPTNKGRVKVHNGHWCYGACSLHDAGLHKAPRTEKHWCDGYR